MRMPKSIHWEKFWSSYPALFYGLFFLLGTFFGLVFSGLACALVVFFFFVSIRCSSQFKKRLGLGLFVFFIGSISAYFSCTYPPCDEAIYEGVASVRLESAQQKMRYGKPFWKNHLSVHSFTTINGKKIAKNISCLCLQEHPDFKLDKEYLVEGQLIQIQPRMFIFKPKRIISSKNSESFFSFPRCRKSMHEHVHLFFASQMPPSLSRDFLQGLLFGEIQNDQLMSSIAKVGLQHLLVVSGFHFGCLMLIIGMLLKPFGYGRKSICALLFIVGAYFIFIGNNPSVFRAFVMTATSLFAMLLRQNSSSLNALGVALLVLLGWDPTYALHLGFQLSFLATFGILLLYHPVKELVCRAFPKRSSIEFLQLGICSQIGAAIIGFVRSAFCLTLVVQLMVLPILIGMPKGFALHSIVYNIFIPVLIGLGMQLSLIGFCCYFIPYVKDSLFYCANGIVDFALSFLLHPPEVFLQYSPVFEIPVWGELMYLCIVIYFGVIFSQAQEDTEIKQPLYLF